MNNTGIILTLAYPETVVMVADEWYSPFMRYIGIGKKNYVRAGHAALVLINKETGELNYHDFGRYITPEPNGRVRGKNTDHELNFPLTAKIEGNKVVNLKEILRFLGTHPKLTHGDGMLIASVCDQVDYNIARDHIKSMQKLHFIRYAAFIKNASNCARFVTTTLIASVTDYRLKKKLVKSMRFTPSTVGNVINADSQDYIYEVSESGVISRFKHSVSKINRMMFLDKLKAHKPNFIGTLKPKTVKLAGDHAQWLSGIAAGAWFELQQTDNEKLFRFKRISPNNTIDVDGLYEVEKLGFDYGKSYQYIQYSNCEFFHIQQEDVIYRFNIKEKFN